MDYSITSIAQITNILCSHFDSSALVHAPVVRRSVIWS